MGIMIETNGFSNSFSFVSCPYIFFSQYSPETFPLFQTLATGVGISGIIGPIGLRCGRLMIILQGFQRQGLGLKEWQGEIWSKYSHKIWPAQAIVIIHILIVIY
jgi:hypothetical protein